MSIVTNLTGHNSSITGLDLSYDGSLLSSGLNGDVYVWNATTETNEKLNNSNPVSSLEYFNYDSK